MSEIRNKVVIVTGGAAGIGRAMVLALARQGARVVAADVSSKALADLRTILSAEDLQTTVLTVEIDLSQPGSGDALCDFATRSFGPIFALVNNAGIGHGFMRDDVFIRPPKTWEMTEAHWDRFIAINANAVFRTMRAVIPGMLDRKSGRIVNVGTSFDSMVGPGLAGYGPSKAAAESLSAVTASDLAGTGVTLNVLIPGGLVDTAMVPENVPFSKAGLLQPDCMVAPLLWLLSAEADSVTARRIRANLWNGDVPGMQSLEAAGAPIAWSSLAGQRRKVEGAQ